MKILSILAIVAVGVFWYFSGLLKKPGQRTKKNAWIALVAITFFVVVSLYDAYVLWPW